MPILARENDLLFCAFSFLRGSTFWTIGVQGVLIAIFF
jgi:hypothetical protein